MVDEEREPVRKKITALILYCLGPVSRFLFNAFCLREWISDRNIDEGLLDAATVSRPKILEYIRYYGLTMVDFREPDPGWYPNFAEFAAREHREGARPVHGPFTNENAVVCVDSMLVAYATVDQARRSWIRGSNFSIENLVMDVTLGQQFENGSLAMFRIPPQYSSWCVFPISGKIKHVRTLPGYYRGLNKRAIRSQFNVLTTNPRKYLLMDSPDFGEVLIVLLGAAKANTIKTGLNINDDVVEKGTNMCHFHCQDAVVLVVFQKGRIVLDGDLTGRSGRCIQTAVQWGMSLGVATEPASSHGSQKFLKSSLSSSSLKSHRTSLSSVSPKSSVSGSAAAQSSDTSRTPSVTFADTTNFKERDNGTKWSKEGETIFAEALNVDADASGDIKPPTSKGKGKLKK